MPLWSASPQALRWVQTPMHDSCLAMWRCCWVVGLVGATLQQQTRTCPQPRSKSSFMRRIGADVANTGYCRRGQCLCATLHPGIAIVCMLLCTLAWPLPVGYFMGVACKLLCTLA